MILFITGPDLVVHRLQRTGTTCPAATRVPGRHQVTLNQCLVYGLPGCGQCWGMRTYETYVKRGY